MMNQETKTNKVVVIDERQLLDTEEYKDVIPDMYKSLELKSVKVVM